jgi:hypothetical protein
VYWHIVAIAWQQELDKFNLVVDETEENGIKITGCNV